MTSTSIESIESIQWSLEWARASSTSSVYDDLTPRPKPTDGRLVDNDDEDDVCDDDDDDERETGDGSSGEDDDDEAAAAASENDDRDVREEDIVQGRRERTDDEAGVGGRARGVHHAHGCDGSGVRRGGEKRWTRGRRIV